MQQKMFRKEKKDFSYPVDPLWPEQWALVCTFVVSEDIIIIGTFSISTMSMVMEEEMT